jgi:hypothetical protein
MRYRDRSELADIQAAIDAIHSDLQRSELTDGLIFDVVASARRRYRAGRRRPV